MNSVLQEKNSQNSRWRRYMLNSLGIVILVEITLEVIWYLIFGIVFQDFELPFFRYFLHYPVISAAVNIPVCFAARYLEASKKYSEQQKNRIVCAALLIVSLEVQFVHDDLTALLPAPVIAIVVSMMLLDRKMAVAELVIAFVVTGLTTIRAVHDDIYHSASGAAANCVAAWIFSVAAFIVMGSLARYQSDQMKTLRAVQRRQTRMMEEMKIDPLTGLYNRKTFDETVSVRIRSMMDWEKTGAYPANMPVMAILDIDLFKKVNDTYGHLRGDEVLMNLSSCMRTRTAGVASAFRYGGEEFVILSDKINIDQVVKLLEDIRSDFSSIRYSFAPGIRVTVSAGIAQLAPGMNEKTWFALADSALYKAKKTGRDKVVVLKEMI
ncbi:MAG: diguanylate cyclase [Anaerovoracaceae bacterium]